MIKFKVLLFTFLLVVSNQFLQAQDVDSKFSKVKEVGGIEEYLYTPNGMNLLLVQDNSAPVVTVQIVYRVGSKHEVPGNTGSTHLLEHLMFKGTEKFNKRKGTSIDSKLNGIGAQMNATTWNDRTNYYETIPSDKIGLALEIEADRMRNSLLLKEDKEAEMTVVRNEFELEENDPFQILNKEVWASAYMAHPYHHSTIGWRSDIENMPMEVLRNFYDTYYWPDNATLTIIGDFQKERLFELVDRYFGKITKAPHDMPQPYTEEPPQYGPRKVVVKKAGQQSVILLGYKIPGRLHEDLPALTVLGQLVGSGTNSTLSKTFVDTGKAYFAFASPSYLKETGLFSIGLGFSPDGNHQGLNDELLATIETVKVNVVSQDDVDRVVAKLNAQSILSRDGSGSIASQLTEAIAGGDWTEYINASKKLSKVTAADVKRVANQYLVEDQSTTGYFIPEMEGGGDQLKQNGASKFMETELGKYYYRHPDHSHNKDNKNYYAVENTSSAKESSKDVQEPIGNRVITRETIKGIDVITTKTGAKDFVTVAASFPIGAYYNTGGNELVPRLTARMLSKGTTLNDKFKFSEKLEKLGVSLNIGEGNQRININFKCLKKDITVVMNLLAEELRYPLFDEKEFDIVKNQAMGGLQNGLSNPRVRGGIALSQAIYPERHPNYSSSIEASMEYLKKASLDDIKAFHSNYFGPTGMRLVAVGDVDTQALNKAIKKAFAGWKGGVNGKMKYTELKKTNAKTKVVTIPQKPSAELFIGQYTGLKRTDADYLPFYIGNFTLGGGFSGRLMRTVRDEDGLTYNIGSRHTGHTNSEGHWYVSASFNPDLFQKGMDATMVQLEKWYDQGITADELATKKSNLTGSYKVGMATTNGLANTILAFVERGLKPDYIDQYPKDIEAVTLEQVNNAIKKYIDLDKLIIIKSGSFNENGDPLEQ